MELIGKQIAIETILGQPPELHYPSWYAAQIEKLPPAPPEYLAEQAGILVTDADTISRAKAIDALWKALHEYEDKTEKQFQESDELDISDWLLHRIFVQNMSDIDRQTILNLPPAQPERIKGHWVNGRCDKCNAHAPFWAMASTYYESNFCPNCGADMRGEQDG